MQLVTTVCQYQKSEVTTLCQYQVPRPDLRRAIFGLNSREDEVVVSLRDIRFQNVRDPSSV